MPYSFLQMLYSCNLFKELDLKISCKLLILEYFLTSAKGAKMILVILFVFSLQFEFLISLIA